MKKLFTCIALFSVLTSTAAVAGDMASMSLGDAEAGKALHEKACVACHTTSVYTRPGRKVNSYGGLVGRVNACGNQLKLDLSHDQVNDLVAYLNDNFYKQEQ